MKKKEEIGSVRERLIETASRLFYMQGYNSTGINQIIEEAEVAKASLYQHFVTKEDLAVGYLAKKNVEWFSALGGFIAQGFSPKEKILLAFDFLKMYQNSCQFRGCNFQNISSEVPQDNIKILYEVRMQKTASREFFKDLLAKMGKADLADEVFILFEGAIASSRIYQNAWAIDTAKKTVSVLI